jgi:hypothetical protein
MSVTGEGEGGMGGRCKLKDKRICARHHGGGRWRHAEEVGQRGEAGSGA